MDSLKHLSLHKRDIILVQVYVDDIIFGSTKKAWCDEFEALMKGEFEMSAMGELIFFLGLQVQQRPDGIFIGQDKYVQEILKKFDLESVRTATTPYEAPKPKSKNEPDNPVNVHLYRSMIGSLMYLTASRPDIMFAVSACSRNQVTPTTSNLEAVKKIFKYLKGQPKLGLWYPRESPFVLEAYSDSDYARANKDRKSTTGGCQFLGRRLISWQCKKQTIMATSSTEAEYVAAANCCGQTNGSRGWISDFLVLYMDQVALFQCQRVHTGSLSVPLGVPRVPTGRLKSPELGPLAILATIDETPYTITEDSVRSQLQLADDGGIDDLPIAEIYSGMDNLGLGVGMVFLFTRVDVHDSTKCWQDKFGAARRTIVSIGSMLFGLGILHLLDLKKRIMCEALERFLTLDIGGFMRVNIITHAYIEDLVFKRFVLLNGVSFHAKKPICPVSPTDSENLLSGMRYIIHNEELRSMFEKQAGVEKFDLIQTLHACKQDEGKPVGPYVIR
ncbi:putative ribonuclease H-like domain-containing protein [Tanacetum coccineum]